MSALLKKGVDYIGNTVVFFCHDGNGNFVLAKRSVNCRDEHHMWDAGGGGVEFGDTFEKTLRDEIRQEYCTDVLAFELLGHREVFREQEGLPTHWIAFDYLVLVDRSQVAIGEPHKFDALDWFTLDTMPEELHSQFPNFLRLYHDRLSHLSSLA